MSLDIQVENCLYNFKVFECIDTQALIECCLILEIKKKKLDLNMF